MRLIAFTTLLAALSGYTATSSPERSTAPESTAAVTAVELPTVLDHTGLGPIRLGASFAEVRATGLIGGRSNPKGHPCAFHDLGMPMRGSVVFDGGGTAVSVIVVRGAGTTEGLHNGQEPSRVPQLYPWAVPNAHGYKVLLGTGTEYSAYSIDGTVITSLSVSRVGQTCHG